MNRKQLVTLARKIENMFKAHFARGVPRDWAILTDQEIVIELDNMLDIVEARINPRDEVGEP